MDTPKWALDRIAEAEATSAKKLVLLPPRREDKLQAIPRKVFWLPQLEVLVLRANRITEVPAEIAYLRNLRYLNLAGNNLTSLPGEISHLPRLDYLNVIFNRLTTLPQWIAQLPSLTRLRFGNEEMQAVPSWIARMDNLTALGILGCQLSSVPEFISELQNLTELDLGANTLSTFPEVVCQFSHLEVLFLQDNHLTTLPPSISQLESLVRLDLTLNELEHVPDTIAELRNLAHLNLEANRLSALPDSVSRLQNLTHLNLASNQFTSIPECVYALANVQSLSLDNIGSLGWVRYRAHSSLNKIRQVPSQILKLTSLEELRLDTQYVETPPPEIAKEGIEAIRDYFRQLEAEGTDHVYEAKLLIVGEAGAGKTTLAKKIENPDYELQEDEASTKGIFVIPWSFSLDNEQTFRVNIWDFGGQEIYHATHQFFLTKRSLYALVADTRKEDTDFYYWLHIVDLLSGGSPLLIVKNEKQDRHREINERQLRGQFESLRDTLATNLATNRGLPDLLNAIKYHIKTLPHIGTALPKTWVDVREALENDPRNYMGLDEYLDVCEHHGFTRRQDKLQLIAYLHDLGVCLHFHEDPLLSKTVILKPEWGTDAVYKVLDNERVIRNLGRFTRADLADIWRDPRYADMQAELLRLMLNFKLCYRIPDTRDTYIAPQLLTENQPHYDWGETENLLLRYTYEFMPKGILTRFIVATHPMIADQQCVWKSGVVIEKDQTRAEVIEHYGRREIRVRINGRRKRDLMTIVAYELDRICASFHGLKYSKLIPCNCEVCKPSQQPFFYPLEVLRRFAADKQHQIQCQNSYKMVEVSALIDDYVDDRRFLEGEHERTGRAVSQVPAARAVVQQMCGGNVMKILFLAANPKDTVRLRLDEEIRDIDQALRLADYRDRFELEQQWAVRVKDLQGYLLRYKPDIVHFSGHGSEENEIVLEDNTGKHQAVPIRALSGLFSVLEGRIRFVVLNACFSEPQAQAIAAHVDCVIGMSNKIKDASAISFAASFYQALAFGESVKTAFDLGCVQIDLESLDQKDVPRLIALRANPEEIVFVEK